MRILVLIIMIIAFLIGGGLSFLIKSNIDSRTKNIDYNEIAAAHKFIAKLKKEGVDLEKTEDSEIKNTLEILKNAPAKWRVTASGILGIILGLSALGMVVIAFMKKELVKKVSIAVASMAAVLWLLAPSIKAGMLSGSDPKTIALVILVSLVISSACAFVSYTMHIKKSVTN
ncbi:hypothetical protein [Flavivirga jejuensis]|uniref:Uncharacterized protein n=1 Tax=Flavivirga jejuensis TaxID=870487 RepID=A0ABT8WRE0_9FLAO|nr:hypothetical protein [Flavivirga jejuensis]MDO5975477.1 hypothetical protein [Flavivirga jejuensis]